MRPAYRAARWLLAVLLLGTAVSGCATIHLDAEVDRAVTVSPTDPVYVHLPPDASVSSKNFHRMLVAEMRGLGINAVDDLKDAKLALVFSQGSDTTFMQSNLVVPSASTTTGNIGTTTFSATTLGTTTVPVETALTIQRLYLKVFRVSPEGRVLDRVWDGYLGAKVEQYEWAPNKNVRQLLEFYGKTFKGNVRAAYPEGPPKR